MVVIGAVICEIFGNSEWGDRLRRRADEYREASKNSGVHEEHSKKLDLMGRRASALAGLTVPIYDRDHRNRLKNDYREATEKLYPARIAAREAGDVRRAADMRRRIDKNIENKKVNAINMLPKSLR
jgi:hypothetical protein